MIHRLRLKAALLGLALFTASLAACDNSPRPPGDVGVCYQYVVPKPGEHRFNVLSKNAKTLEECAASLEAMRIHFLMIGGNQTSLTGAYQSKFIFLEPDGIFTADSLNGASYIALVRTNDGRLVRPGAIRQ
jgi:hypothetical protein